MSHRQHELRRRRFRVDRVLTWENALRGLGAGGFVYLLLDSGPEHPAYMIACVGLMVSPSAFAVDRKKKDRE